MNPQKNTQAPDRARRAPHIDQQSFMKLVQKAKYEDTLFPLLKPWYSFRVYIKWIKPMVKNGVTHTKSHFYGFEEDCTYGQCFHGHADNITLNKLAGYENCIEMIESKYKGRFKYAAIYQRKHFPEGKFEEVDICRFYKQNGDIRDQQDPVILDSDNKTLHFSTIGGFLYVHPDKEMSEEKIVSGLFDWSGAISDALK
jgi:hypothetical protein